MSSNGSARDHPVTSRSGEVASRPFGKVVCIGLDGATFDVIDPMVQDGRLPTLAKILSNGTRSKLASVVPPLSAPAWVSFMTGANPGRHGIFHFLSMEGGKLGARLMGSWAYRGRSIFDHASKAGLKVVAFRVPLTYPPWPINGTMVSGFPTPDQRQTYSEPPEVAERVGPLFKLSTVGSMLSDVNDQAENFNYYLERSTEVLVELMGPDVDLFCYVNSITDWIAHKFWKYSDPSAPGYEPHSIEGSTPLEHFYEKTDQSLGALVDAAPDNALLIVLSDHGTGPRTERRFNTNAWLSEIGLLSRASGQRGRRLASLALERAKNVVPQKYWLWQHSPEFVRKSAGSLRSYGGAIEWSRSRAYRIGVDHHVEGVNVNLAGRDPYGSVPDHSYEEVRSELLQAARGLVDPVTGAKVFDAAHRREEIYEGDHAHLAPDVVLILNPAYEFGIGSERRMFSSVKASRLGRSSATHRPDGILAMSGPGVKPGIDLGGANLIDVPATIMWALGLELDDAFDGRVLGEAFEDDLVSSHPVRRGKAAEPEFGTGAYTKEEEQQMAAHLEDLGYM